MTDSCALKLLVAEDDKNFGRVLKSELEDEGYAVDLFPDGVEAVLSFIDNKGEYDFAVIDIKMPKLGGIGALRILRKLKSDLPAITISGNAGSDEAAESVRAGAIRCLTKPFEISILKNDIRRCRSGRMQNG